MNKVELCKQISDTSNRVEELEFDLDEYKSDVERCQKDLAEARRKLRYLIQQLDKNHEGIDDIEVDENP